MHYRYRLSQQQDGTYRALNLQLRTSIYNKNKSQLIVQLRKENDSKYVKVRGNKVIVTINATEN